MDLNKLKIFHSVAKFGGIKNATSDLKMISSSISAAISILEKECSQKLFERHYRGMRLTEDGAILYESTKKIFSEISHAMNLMKNEEQLKKGKLTIATTLGIASADWFMKKISHFLAAYPDIKLKIMSYRDICLDKIEADVYIGPYLFNQPDVIQKKFTTIHFKLFASIKYFEKFEAPKTINDLDHHRLIAFSKELYNPFNDADSLLHIGRDTAKPRELFLEVNNNVSLLKMIEMGEGIGVITPEEAESIYAKPILEQYDKSSDVYLITPKKKKDLGVVKAIERFF